MTDNTIHVAFASLFTGTPFTTPTLQTHVSMCPRRNLVSAANTPHGNAKAGNDNGVDSANASWSPGKVRAPRPKRGGTRTSRGKVRIQGKYYRVPAPRPQAPGLRITSGTVRGRRIQSPNVYLRPMMGKVREALFSMLEMFEILRSDGSILDLFSGSGSIGIEAMSRGMGHGVFVDSAMECAETIEGNLEHCGFEERGKAVCARVQQFLKEGARYNGGQHYDLITLTPPYEEVDYGELMNAVATSKCVGEGTFVVVEYPVEMKTMPPEIGQRLIGIRNRKYGRTVLALYACQPDVDIDRRSEEFVDVKRKR